MEFKLNNIVDGVVGPVAAENAVYHDTTRPSHLLLPVVPDAPSLPLSRSRCSKETLIGVSDFRAAGARFSSPAA